MPLRVAPCLRRLLPAAVLAASGCGLFRSSSASEPPPPAGAAAARVSVDGTWAGVWEIEGQRLEGTLVVRQSGAELHATFTSPQLGGEAAGGGRVGDDGGVLLELDYDLACPGKAQLGGDVQAGRFAGSLLATDCTGRAMGTFFFSRR